MEADEVRYTEAGGRLYFGQGVTHDRLFITAGVERIGTKTHTLVAAFDAETLQEVWNVPVGEALMPSSDTSGLIAHAGRVYVHLPGPATAAVCANTGELLWRTELPSGARESIICRSRPSLSWEDGEARHVLATSLQGEVFAVDAASGELAWKLVPDVSAGIWSPALDTGRHIVVHSGVLLFGLDRASGAPQWCTPVGFDAYTAPLELDGGRIAICGGDPPDDGYLLVVNPSRTAELPQISTSYRQGGGRDLLSIRFDPGKDSGRVDVSVDLRMFGKSSHEKPQRDLTGQLEWRGDVLPTKRLGKSVVFATVRQAANQQIVPVYIDAGSRVEPTELTALAIDPDHLPGTQSSRVGSSGLVVSAVARRHGHEVDAEAAEEAAAWMRRQGVSPHFVWRSGAERLLMASQLPLAEAEGRTVDAHGIDEVLSAWERDQTRA